MAKEQQKYLKKRGENHVYNWTPKLALRPDFVACDINGNALRSVPTLSITTTDVDEGGQVKQVSKSLQTNITPVDVAKMRRDDLLSYADELGVEYDPMEATVKSLRHDILKAMRQNDADSDGGDEE